MTVKKRPILAAAALVAALAGNASGFCFEEAGVQYGINPQILRAIAKVESNFNPAAINYNTNGSYDFGLMQINSIWAPTIGKQRWNTLGDPCASVKTGAWILSMCMEKYGYTWKAIGCYNSQTPDKRDRYSKKVFDQLQRVKPLKQEAAYSPLKNQVEELVRQNVDAWVDDAARGEKEGFAAQVQGHIPSPGEVQVEPPTLADSSLQSALPAGAVHNASPDYGAAMTGQGDATPMP